MSWITLCVMLAMLRLCFVDCQTLTLHSTISDHMVLQRAPLSANIIGTAAPGSVVSLVLDNEGREYTVTNKNGEWMIGLSPHAASYNHTLTITDGATTLTLVDVAFGDVILCAGQSNMQFSLINSFDGPAAIAAASKYSYTIRVFAAVVQQSRYPQSDVISYYGNVRWAQSEAQYLNGSVFDYFSSVCYYGALQLTATLGPTIPLGLMDVAYGGTVIAAWSSAAALSACAYCTLPDYNTTFAIATDVNNAMIQPIINTALTAVWWYQGESDSENEEQATCYACRLVAMINDWRVAFHSPTLPFFQVILGGLPNHDMPNTIVPYSYYIAITRTSQQKSFPSSSGTLATAIDAADPQGPFDAWHSRNKTIVGQRIGNLTLAKIYGSLPSVQSLNILTDGPTFTDTAYSSPCHPTCVVTLRNTTPQRNNVGLRLLDTGACTRCCAKHSPFTTITASLNETDGLVTIIDDSTVTVTFHNLDSRPIRLNYMYEAMPECGLYNRDRWPMRPFSEPAIINNVDLIKEL